MTAEEKGIRLERRVVLITTCSTLAAALALGRDDAGANYPISASKRRGAEKVMFVARSGVLKTWVFSSVAC
jgi:hypothetical protein